MLKGQKKHIDKEQGKIKHDAPRSVNYRATQNKNNIGTTALERSVVYTTGDLKAKSICDTHIVKQQKYSENTRPLMKTSAVSP